MTRLAPADIIRPSDSLAVVLDDLLAVIFHDGVQEGTGRDDGHRAGENLGDRGAPAKVHLGRLAGGKVEHAGGLGGLAADLSHPAPDGGVVAGKAELGDQSLVDRGGLNTLFHPLPDVLLIRLGQRRLGLPLGD